MLQIKRREASNERYVHLIKKLGTTAREEIEKFLQQKVFLELFVKVKPNWRENELQLREYGF